MRSSHKQDKYLLEQAYVNLRENDNSMNPEEVVENLKRLFPKHPEVERIYDTNMDAFGEITSDVVESIAEELREAGYSTGFILQNTGIDLSITHKGGYPDGTPGIIQDDAGSRHEQYGPVAADDYDYKWTPRWKNERLIKGVKFRTVREVKHLDFVWDLVEHFDEYAEVYGVYDEDEIVMVDDIQIDGEDLYIEFAEPVDSNSKFIPAFIKYVTDTIDSRNPPSEGYRGKI